MEGLISHADEASYYAMKNVLPTYSKGKMEVKNILEKYFSLLVKGIECETAQRGEGPSSTQGSANVQNA